MPARSETVSVIVPIYNAETTLRRCLSSLRKQTYPDLEILMLDDGSTDGSPDICREFADA
ncbi:MAG: glycosyltransferase family 2 protein, partial [Lachnospiraceae bacterium]|nr:glycosyltransferase family 2 protein [Lachnospiraceae bacterium]